MLIKEQNKIIHWSWLNIFNNFNLYFVHDKYAVFLNLIIVAYLQFGSVLSITFAIWFVCSYFITDYLLVITY